VFDAEPTLSIGDVALDPKDPNVVWVGTGEANSSGDTFPGTGVYLSTDRGATWQQMGLADTQQIGRVVVDPTDSNTIWVAAIGNQRAKDVNRGVYRSKDKGKTWQNVLFRADDTGAIDLAIDPSAPGTVYAAFWERVRTDNARVAGGKQSGIFKTTDGGATWTQLTHGLPASASTTGRIGVSVCASQPKTVYAIFDDTKKNFNGVYRSDDGGATWARTKDKAIAQIYATYGWWFGNVRCSPTDPKTVFAVGFGVAKTTDGGKTWKDASGNMHPDNHALYIDPAKPSHVYVGNDGGFHISNDGGRTYQGPVKLPVTQFYDVSIDPNNPTHFYGGAQDNGVVRTLSAGTSNWEPIYGGDGMYTFVDPTNSSIVYAESQNGALGKSTDSGNSFNDIGPQFDRSNWNTPVHLDPKDHNTIYFGATNMFRSSDGGTTFTAFSPDLTNGPSATLPGFGTISTFDVAQADTSTVYAGTDDGNVWGTHDAGATWNKIMTGLPTRYVTRIIADPANASRVFVSFSGYGKPGHLFQSDDAGKTWKAIDAGLPQVPVNVILRDPKSATALYVGTDVGVFVSQDLGATWTAISQGMPVVPVLDLALDQKTRTLLAGTHGRSMYTTKI
jgi:photosystem II stability/assembly factor-like uncharacterized protein